MNNNRDHQGAFSSPLRHPFSSRKPQAAVAASLSPSTRQTYTPANAFENDTVLLKGSDNYFDAPLQIGARPKNYYELYHQQNEIHQAGDDMHSVHSQQRPQLAGSLTRHSEGRFSIHSKQPTVDEDLASMGARTNSNAPMPQQEEGHMEFDINQYFHDTASANGGQPIQLHSAGLFNTSSPTPTLEQQSNSSTSQTYPMANLNQNYRLLQNEHSQSTQISSENRKNQRASSSTASQIEEETYTEEENTHNSKKRTAKKVTQNLQPLLAEDAVEQALDDEMNAYVERDEKVREQESQLLALKRQKNLSKKELQVQRNRITAQLSRDRKILETEFMRMELLKMRRQVNDLHKELLQPGEFCPKCQLKVLTTLDLEGPAPPIQEETRVTSREHSGNVRKRSSAGAIHIGGSGVSKRQMMGLALFAVVAMVGLVGFTGNNNEVMRGNALHQTKSSQLVPLSQGLLPTLYEGNDQYVSSMEAPQQSQLMLGNENTYALISTEDFQTMRENYLQRETLRLVNRKNQIVISEDKGFNNRYIVKAVKATTPSYYSLQQLDDGSHQYADLDEENDTIVMKPKKESRKFLYESPKPTLAQSLYSRLDLETTSVLCPNTQTLFSPNSREGVLLSGGIFNGDGKASELLNGGQHKIQLIMSPQESAEPNLAYIEVTCSVEGINYVYDKYTTVQAAV